VSSVTSTSRKDHLMHTIVLVHGAFAESSSWDGVVDPLLAAGHHVVAAANPLRGLAADAAAVSDVVAAIDGPVLLVGHSYGGSVISNVDADAGQVVGLVYVCAFAPEPGESCLDLSSRFPGSTLGEALRPIPRRDGTTDLAIVPERFHDQFCADLPAGQAARMAVGQRPVTQEALQEPAGLRPLWREHPSWFLIGAEDRNIPADAQRFMAQRAGARDTVELAGASHAAAVSQPRATADLILAASRLPAAV
jgi:pimeloyl-ACP methyl ester carboxylesterase